MAHFAELDQNSVVLRVVVVGDDVAQTEGDGVAFCRRLFGSDTTWRQTSYNTSAGAHLSGGEPFRKNFAGIGFAYDAERDAFIPPQPMEEGRVFSLDEQTCTWLDVTPSAFKGVTRL